jgi:hypothetical protein
VRSRRLLIILVIFIVLAGMGIIGGTVFRVRNIDIVFTKTAVNLDKAKVNEKLLLELEYLKGKNILFNTDKDAIKKIVEDTEIFLKVVNIKAKFPNTIVIDVRERYPVYIYKEGTAKTYIMDAEMRVLYIEDDYTGDGKGLVDISFVGSGLFSADIVKGSYVMGVGESNQEKIRLINIIPEFFEGNSSYEAALIHQIREITFAPTVDGIITMIVDVKPAEDRDIDVQLKIMRAPNEDFTELFACVWGAMERQIDYKDGDISKTKAASQAGTYIVYYSTDGALEVLWDSADADTLYDAKFVTAVE